MLARILPLALLCAGPALAEPSERCANAGTPPAEAVTACTAAIGSTLEARERASLYLWRGHAHRRAGNREAALADYEEAEWLVPGWAQPMIERAYLYAEAGDFAAAAEEALRGIATEPDSVQAHRAAMDHLADAGRAEDCLDLVPAAMALGPQDARTVAARGRCLQAGGRPAPAIADFRRAIELGLDDPFVRGNLAILLLDEGQAEAAVPEAQRWVELDPGSALALRTLAVALVVAEGPEAAVAAWREGVAALASDRDYVANDLAWNLYVAGHHAEGLAVLEEAVAAGMSLGDVDAADTQAHLLAANGRAGEAVAAFLRAAELGGAERRSVYGASLARLGYRGEDLAAALGACVAAGAACRLSE